MKNLYIASMAFCFLGSSLCAMEPVISLGVPLNMDTLAPVLEPLLFKKVNEGDIHMVQCLLSLDVDVNAMDIENNSEKSLHKAARNNDLKMVKLLLSYGARTVDPDTQWKLAVNYTTDQEIKELLEDSFANSKPNFLFPGINKKRKRSTSK